MAAYQEAWGGPQRGKEKQKIAGGCTPVRGGSGVQGGRARGKKRKGARKKKKFGPFWRQKGEETQQLDLYVYLPKRIGGPGRQGRGFDPSRFFRSHTRSYKLRSNSIQHGQGFPGEWPPQMKPGN